MSVTIVYAIRFENLWWCGRNFVFGHPEKCDRYGSPFLKDATFFSDDILAEDIATQLGGKTKRVDLVTE